MGEIDETNVSLGVIITIFGAVLTVAGVVMPLLSMFTKNKINTAKEEIMLWVEKKNQEQNLTMKEFINLKIEALQKQIDGIKN